MTAEAAQVRARGMARTMWTPARNGCHSDRCARGTIRAGTPLPSTASWTSRWVARPCLCWRPA